MTRWQAQNLVMLEGYLCCSAQKWMTCHVWPGSIMRVLCRGSHSIWWCWKATSVASRNVNDVSCVTRINHESAFWWKAQYLVMLEGYLCCSAQCTWRFMCDCSLNSCYLHCSSVAMVSSNSRNSPRQSVQKTGCGKCEGFSCTTNSIRIFFFWFIYIYIYIYFTFLKLPAASCCTTGNITRITGLQRRS